MMESITKMSSDDVFLLLVILLPAVHVCVEAVGTVAEDLKMLRRVKFSFPTGSQHLATLALHFLRL